MSAGNLRRDAGHAVSFDGGVYDVTDSGGRDPAGQKTHQVTDEPPTATEPSSAKWTGLFGPIWYPTCVRSTMARGRGLSKFRERRLLESEGTYGGDEAVRGLDNVGPRVEKHEASGTYRGRSWRE